MIFDFVSQLTRLSNKLNELERVPVDFGTGELLYPSEIHTIQAIGNKYDTVTELSICFGITKGAVSQVISKLCKRGYVSKKRNEAYSKEIILHLTEKGQKAYQNHEELHKIMDSELVNLMEGFPEQWFEYFCNVLAKIEQHVDKYLQLHKKS